MHFQCFIKFFDGFAEMFVLLRAALFLDDIDEQVAGFAKARVRPFLVFAAPAFALQVDAHHVAGFLDLVHGLAFVSIVLAIGFAEQPIGVAQLLSFRIIPSNASAKVNIAYSDITALAFTGRDTAAGKTFEAWVKKYWEKKAAGEKNIQIEPEKLD